MIHDKKVDCISPAFAAQCRKNSDNMDINFLNINTNRATICGKYNNCVNCNQYLLRDSISVLQLIMEL